MEQIREKGAVGEICGRFFDSRGQECTTDYRDRVIGIELDELHQKPEVIGVTSGQGKIEAIYAACCGGLIKSLVIDEAGAQALVARATGVRATEE
jgi:DNA-binding transcriptional regulator LsrR (DeoR family)